MDWYSWLSRSTLDPSLVSEYALLLSRNELEQPDIPYFDHAFLQSMGISIAKHRLEILKLAKRHRTPRPLARLLGAVRRFRSIFLSGDRCRDERSAIVVMPGNLAAGSGRWRLGAAAAMRRSQRVVVVKQRRLMITDGAYSSTPKSEVGSGGGGGGGDEFWKCGGDGDEIRWDCMFQDLKPT